MVGSRDEGDEIAVLDGSFGLTRERERVKGVREMDMYAQYLRERTADPTLARGR